MEILQSHEHGVRTLGIVGDFDSTDVDAFRAHIDEAIDGECYRVLVDAGQLRFINSTALGSLIGAQKRLNEFGGDIAVCALSGFAVGIFRTLGLERKISCFRDSDQAVEYLQGVGDGCVDVPGAADLGFIFSGEEQIAVAGDEPRSAIVKALSDQRVVFRWVNDEDIDAAKVMVRGAKLHVRFRLPLFIEDHTFDAVADVETAKVGPEQEVIVTARFAVLADVERRGIQQFVRDMRFLGGAAGASNEAPGAPDG